ncbi:MAG: hypothetical protein EXX96DRAFT_647437 [Benjaminiella poitrasii]|nr:MAG: hypothetical protein EXX96DRAFT_647437 [Benjaminiella poitrasii]
MRKRSQSRYSSIATLKITFSNQTHTLLSRISQIGVPIQAYSSFSYLGVPFGSSGYFLPSELVSFNTTKAIATMSQLSAIGVNHTSFTKPLSSRFYI